MKGGTRARRLRLRLLQGRWLLLNVDRLRRVWAWPRAGDQPFREVVGADEEFLEGLDQGRLRGFGCHDEMSLAPVPL